MPIFQFCSHCGEKVGVGTKLCKDCRLKSQRAEMDEENRKVWKATGKEFHCEYCEKERLKKLNKEG